MNEAERWRSPAAGSGSDAGADAGGSQVQCFVRRGLCDCVPPWYSSAIVSGSIFAWRWSFQMQAINMGDQFSFRGPATEVEAEHLIRPLGRCLSDPQAEQQARNEGGIDLDTHPIHPLAQQMPAAQHTFDPAEKQLHRP